MKKSCRHVVVCLFGLLMHTLAFAPSISAADAPGAFRTGKFPYFEQAKQFDMWEFTPLDQGGRLVQLQVVKSERDADIVKAVRSPGFFNDWGNPIKWDSLETTQVEKSVWLNRWYIMPSFARMYYTTGDRVYLDEMLAFMRKWTAENSAPADVKAYAAQRPRPYNWLDMQVAWRTQCLAWCYFLGEKGFTASEKAELYELIKTHAHALLEFFGDQKLIENNHQSHGASAMLYASVLFPDIPNAQTMREKALYILNHHVAEAFTDDGNSVELVPGYYPFFTSVFRDVYNICNANGVPPPVGSKERLTQLYHFLGQAVQPNGLMPPINDSSESSADVPLRALAEILGQPYPYPQPKSHWFDKSGQAVMRDYTKTQPAYAFLDAGPTVLAHWHGGKLGFHLWFWDKPLVIDTGISNYDDPLKRTWYNWPEAHNTVLVDGKGDYYKGTNVENAKRPLAGSSITHWESNDRYDWAQMEHTGLNYGKDKDPVFWVRHFIMIKGVGAVVIDQLESAQEHEFTWLFHPTSCTPKVDIAQKSVFTAFDSYNVLLRPANPTGLERFVMSAGNYNRLSVNYTGPVVNYSTRGKGAIQAFLMLPVAGSKAPALTLSQTTKGGGVQIVLKGAPVNGGKPLTIKLAPKGELAKHEYALTVEQ